MEGNVFTPVDLMKSLTLSSLKARVEMPISAGDAGFTLDVDSHHGILILRQTERDTQDNEDEENDVIVTIIARPHVVSVRRDGTYVIIATANDTESVYFQTMEAAKEKYWEVLKWFVDRKP